METAVGAASWLVGKVLNKLSDDLVAAYVASSELGLNAEQIKDDLTYTYALLHAAQGRDDNPGLRRLLEQLSEKADEAEDALDELHYYIIRDKLDGTQHATPFLGGDLREKVQHGRNAVCHTTGNWLSCFSCCRTEDAATTAVTDNPQNIALSDIGSGSVHLDQFAFDRVAMSNKIKSVIEAIRSKCIPVSDLLKIQSQSSTAGSAVTLKRTPKGSTMEQNKLYGRSIIFEKTIEDITGGTYHSESLYVLPIVGPGGIGKTTFTQHLYNNERTEQHFTIRVWVCVSSDFDVLKLTQQIHSCIPATEKEESNITNGTTNLDQLQISITRRLKTKRFLLVLDDIWKCDSDAEWATLLSPFTKGEAKGSMVLVTTRFPKIEKRVKKSTVPIKLQGLEPKEFLEFFQACAFGTEKPDEQYNELIDIGTEIAAKLKCSPLAATTVARLLKKHLSWEHWSQVLENNEWKNQKNDDDIMPALKISYDYLPFHLKQCFSYFALFPEDYRFKNLEITYFWIAIGIVEKYENYMEELVDNGFLVKENDGSGEGYYVLHDLLHELSRSVSSQECLNIYSSGSFRDDIPKTIRHLSITMEDKYDDSFRGEMVKLRSKLDIVNLRSLMIFREYGEIVEDILKNTFEEIQGLRVLFLLVKSSESVPFYLSKLIHLRFLKITSTWGDLPEPILPSTLSRFYHMKLLDLSSWYGSDKLPEDISRLINLCHFITNKPELHSNVPEIGKMRCLKELTKFCVKKESAGFELSELGALTQLGGKLGIYNLEKVATKEEAMKAKLVSKGDLKELTLVWGESDVPDDSRAESRDVLDGLEPHSNLQSLAIKNHGGSTGSHWLCGDISIQMLKSLSLEGVSWVTLPPFEQLPHLTSLTLRDIYEVCEIRSGFGGATDKSFLQLKHIILDGLPKLIEWVGAPNAHQFSRLEDICCSKCPNLCTLPFLQECSAVSYNHLLELKISECPKLFLPPMPHTSTLTSVAVEDSPAGRMVYLGHRMYLIGYSSALAWHNIAGKVESITFEGGSKIPWAELPKLTSLSSLLINEDPNFLSMALLSNLSSSLTSLSLINCENLTVDGFNPLVATVNLKILVVFNTGGDGPRSVAPDLLSELVVAKQLFPAGCFQLERLEVDCISAVLAAPVCSLFATTLHQLNLGCDQRVESFTEEEENALQLLTSLRTLTFGGCTGLPSLPQGLHSLSSLRELHVSGCPEIRSMPKGGLPASLRILYLSGCREIRSLPKECLPTSLRVLYLSDCPEIRSLPKGGLPASLRKLNLSGCREMRSLPAEGLPTSLQELSVYRCSPDLHKQAKELQATKPNLQVYT